MSEKKTTNASRTRNFATVVYPESAPENWQDILSDCRIPAFISPLHDADVNPTGEPKKPHFHVILAFEGPKTVEQAVGIFSLIGGVGCEIVQSLRGYARYLCHLDNPEKHQYDISLVKSLCGADYASAIDLVTDKYKAIGEMQDFCEEYDINSFYLLSRYAKMHRSDWQRVLCDSGSVFMREYLKSRKWSKDSNEMHIVDPATGEIII
jgi:hypothetical protein